MKLILSSFLLLHYLGVRAQVQLLQPQSLSVQYGGHVRLPCTTSGYQFTSYWLAWLKQVPRNEPKYMGRIYPNGGSQYFTESFKKRFVISTDNSKSMAYLDINDVRLEDTAIYYCARDMEGRLVSLNTDGLVFGTGTRLDVLPNEKPTTAPQVFELKTKGETSSTACLAKDFFPKDIEIYVNNFKQESITTILSKNGLYSAVSVQNVKSDVFGCEVKQPESLVQNTTEEAKVETTYNPPEEEKGKTCERTDNSSHNTEQINMLSLTVCGMRALLAKTLTFNLILSAKIFIM